MLSTFAYEANIATASSGFASQVESIRHHGSLWLRHLICRVQELMEYSCKYTGNKFQSYSFHFVRVLNCYKYNQIVFLILSWRKEKDELFCFQTHFFKFQDISTLNGTQLYPRCTCHYQVRDFFGQKVSLSEEVHIFEHSYGGAWTIQWFIHYTKPGCFPITERYLHYDWTSHYDWRYLH